MKKWLIQIENETYSWLSQTGKKFDLTSQEFLRRCLKEITKSDLNQIKQTIDHDKARAALALIRKQKTELSRREAELQATLTKVETGDYSASGIAKSSQVGQ